MEAGDTDVDEHERIETIRSKGCSALLDDGEVGGAAAADDDLLGAPLDRSAPHDRRDTLLAARVLRENSVRLIGISPGEHDRPVVVGEQFADDAYTLVGGLAGPVDRLGTALAQ